jgi:hypothetical protein
MNFVFFFLFSLSRISFIFLYRNAHKVEQQHQQVVSHRAKELETRESLIIFWEKKSKSLDDGGGAVPARTVLTPPPSFALLPAFASFLFQKEKEKQVAGAMGKAVGPSRQPRTVHALNLRPFLKREKRFYYKEDI